MLTDQVNNSTSPVQDTGLIRCYNMFPGHFNNIQDMTSYLAHVAEMGFNVVWINPLQLAGDFVFNKQDPITAQNQSVSKSLYAMSSTQLIDPRFSMVEINEFGFLVQAPNPEMGGFSAEEFNHLGRLSEQYKLEGSDREEFLILKQKQDAYCFEVDKLYLKQFTEVAKSHGLTPIFDLVLNHVSKDSQLIVDHPQFFDHDDRTFPDTTAFIYSKLLGHKYSKELSVDEEQAIIELIPQVLETVWNPFINLYINELGFCGARVDCIKKIPVEVRAPLYQQIRQGVATQVNPCEVVILEEALFSDCSPAEFAEKVKGAGATHITGSTYYRKRLWDGSLEDNYSDEDFHKSSMVEKGVINFTGNHDHYSCAMTLCRELAFERLQHNANLYQTYQQHTQDKIDEDRQKGKSTSNGVLENIKSLYIHHYVLQIIYELEDPYDNYPETVMRFGRNYLDKLGTSAFSGSGGFYMLSGDEFASFHHPYIFLDKEGQTLFPTFRLNVFNELFEHKDIQQRAFELLNQLALKTLQLKKVYPYYETLDEQNKTLFLSPYREKIFKDIHSELYNQNKENFYTCLEAEIYHLIDCQDKARSAYYQAVEPIPLELTSSTKWGAPKSLNKYTHIEQLQEINEVLSKLPLPKEGFWSELFKSHDEDVLISVRVNGFGFDGDVDVVISNLNPYKPLSFGLSDLEKAAQWFQARAFYNRSDYDDSLYKKAYACIMGKNHLKAPPNLYFTGLFDLDDNLFEHHVQMDGRIIELAVIQAPKNSREPEPPPEFLQEDSSVLDELISQFKKLSHKNTSISSKKADFKSDSSFEFDFNDESFGLDGTDSYSSFDFDSFELDSDDDQNFESGPPPITNAWLSNGAQNLASSSLDSDDELATMIDNKAGFY